MVKLLNLSGPQVPRPESEGDDASPPELEGGVKGTVSAQGFPSAGRQEGSS